MIPRVAFNHATICLKRSYTSRTISASLPSKPVKTKIKKAFADLPSTYIRPDGTVAEPLGEWHSGKNICDIPSSSLLSASSLEAAEMIIRHKLSKSDTDNPEANDLAMTPKRVKRGKTDVTSSEVTTANAKRKQKRKKSDPVIPDTHEEPTPSNAPNSEQPQTMLAQEILENLRKFPHCLLLTRVGQFYESYFDQAVEISRLLSIKLTTRKWGSGRVHMCGFPLIHLDKHLKVLVQQNKRFVAMCEEFPKYSDGSKTFDRRVTRVVTPGTLIDEPFLNPFENNYLLAIGVLDIGDALVTSTPLGLAWIDVSTGEFFSKGTNLDTLRDELARIAPREVVLDNCFKEMANDHPLYEALAEDDNFVSYVPPGGAFVGGHSTLPTGPETPMDDILQVSDLTTAVLDRSPEESSAIRVLTAYLNANLLEHMPTLSSPNREGSEERMQIDSHTIKALEIKEGFREGGTKGSLLSVIKRTVTTGGNRLLSRWLCSPSTSISEINARQSLVAFFHARPHFRTDLVEALKDVDDTTRIVQKFMLGRGETADLLGVRRTARAWADIVKRVQHEKELETMECSDFKDEDWASLDNLMARMVGLDILSNRIGTALDDMSSYEPLSPTVEASEHEQAEETPTNSSNGLEILWRYGPSKWSIKPSFSRKLSSLHNSLQKLLVRKAEMEAEIQLKYDAPSLTLRASPAQGMHVHLAKAKRDQGRIIADPLFISIAESASTRSFFFKDWSHLGSLITDTTQALIMAEKEAFETLRDEVNSHSVSLRSNARILDELDVAMSFATLASELNFVRPRLSDKPVYQVTNGRHPTVELGLLAIGRTFTPNSLVLSSTSKLHVITGPNMAGKSTFLRQTALIAILAQTGSFVPAEFAVMGIVDKLFSRIGAKDDLFHDRSTFMVEMLETAEILRRATPKSLVIMDEVGRGTTVTDGLAIAYATLHHLVNVNQCRALFATHFHELADMLGYPNQLQNTFGHVEFFCTDVDETDDDRFAYQYRVRPGVNRNSHGLKVAQLAGMPSAAMNVAKEALTRIKAKENDACGL